MGAIKIVTAAAEDPISLEQAKLHLRVDDDDDDDLIEALISAATQYAEKFQGRALIEQTFDYYLDAFPIGEIQIPRPPLIEVQGVFYLDSNGDEQEFTTFEVDTATEPGRIYLTNSGSWPTPADQLNAVRVRFRAGYLDVSSPAVANVPFTTIAAIKMIIGTLYAQRESIAIGAQITSAPWGADQLLRQNKVDVGFA